MATDITTIKNWFKTGLKPTQAQFWATWDSYWHKDEKISISAINNLEKVLDNKADNTHEHSQYATNDATSLTDENILEWQKALKISDLKFDDKAITTTQDYSDFGLEKGATINSFNNSIYQTIGNKLDKPTEEGTTVDYPFVVGVNEDNESVKLPAGDLGKNFANTDLEVTENRKHSGTNTVEFGMPLVFSNANQQFKNLPDKSSDATYNELVGKDSNGNLAKVGINALTKTMQNASDAQKDAWRLANRKTNETYSVGQPRIDTILPPIIGNTKDYIQYVTLVGLNLFVNNSNPSTSSVSIVRYKDINNQLIPEETHIIDNYQVYQANQSILSFGIDYSLFPTGYYKVKVVHNGFENIGNSDILVTTQVTTKPIVLDSWEVYTPYDASSLIVSPTSIKKTYTTNRGNILEQQVKHFIILEEDVIRGFRINFTYKLTPSGTELDNIIWRSAINFGLGYDKSVDGTIVPEILISFFRGFITIGTKTMKIPNVGVPTFYDVDIVVKNGSATVILNSKVDGKILTNTFSFEQLNSKMFFYSTFIGSNADFPQQIKGTTQEVLFTNTYQTF